ncbi:hypothetical protein [Ectobacillus antri]|uniref:hypothetical protein n=1 Tax=Ectobacillus antri TaxID=2486280 RepID=UPI000F5B3DFA|nr:hypothetical protein [Ectobacillus antri]
MKTKKDIYAVLSNFASIADYDAELQKYYLVFSDRKRGGVYTLMRKGEQWSTHGYGLDYMDDRETFLTEKEVVDFLWIHRAAFRQTVMTIHPENVVYLYKS